MVHTSQNPKQHRFVALDSLRGISAMLLVMYHVWPTWPCYLLVDFFMALSGFILSHSYLAMSHPSWRDFMVIRMARMYPLHLYSLIMIGVVYLIFRGELPVYDDALIGISFLMHVFLLNGMGFGMIAYTWNFPAWTISTEMFVNAAFYYLVDLKTSIFALIAVPVVIYSLMFFTIGHMNFFVQNIWGVLNTGLLRVIAAFTMGLVAYRAFLYVEQKPDLRKLLVNLQLPVFIIVGLFISIPEKQTAYDFLSVPFLFLMLVCFAFEEGFAKRLDPLQYTGTISYSIYMNHIAVITVFKAVWGTGKETNPVLFGAAILAATLLYSSFTFKYVERPAQKAVLKRFIAKPKQEKPATT